MRGSDSTPDNPCSAGAVGALQPLLCSPVLHLPGKLVHGSQVVLVQDAVPKSIPKAPEKQEGSL